MLFAVFFAFWRFLEILTLIPTLGMLAWFVHGFIHQNELTPDYILVTFIVSVLGAAWAIFTLFHYHRSSSNAHFVALVDLAFMGAFIAGAYLLRFIRSANCSHVQAGDPWTLHAGNLVTLTGHGIDIVTDKPCAMLKACFAFAIMNVVFFACTAVLAFLHGGHLAGKERDRRYVRETTTTTTTSHRRRSSHGSRSRARSGSHHSRHSHGGGGGGSRRSSHSHQRSYV